jgi:16S rRNA G966 N2-methylase RsmD
MPEASTPAIGGGVAQSAKAGYNSRTGRNKEYPMRLKHYGWALAVGMTLVFAGAGSMATSRAAASEAASTPTATMPAAALMALAQGQATLREPDVIYVPTPDYVVEAMLKMANVTASDVVYDLGSGDGRIPITAAQKYGARGVGIDINPQRIKEANENLAKAGVGDKVQFLNQDLFETDLSPATVVTLYLLPSLNQKLMPKLKALKPGTRIVSHSFDMGTAWPPEKTEDVKGRVIYYWTIK